MLSTSQGPTSPASPASPAPAPLPPAPPSPPSFGRRLFGLLNKGSLGVTAGFAFTVALLISPIFATSFAELLARTLFIAFVLLATFIGVQRLPEAWLPRWLPRWVASLIAICIAAPVATFAVYVAGLRGDVFAFIQNEPRLRGFIIIAGIALTLGMLIALGAQLRQRDAEARAQALRFELERSQLERQAAFAQLSLLQAQIQPHFLFNTLANVQALVESQSPRAPELLKSLIAYLRASMPRLQGGPVTLGDELGLVRAYLQLMQMRMPDRMSYAVNVDASLLKHAFPALALLTLVENAVHHGIDPSMEGGHIDVGGAFDHDAGMLRLWVQDSGVGMNPMAQPGTGLTNLRARLLALHGPTAMLDMREVEPHGVRAEISLPSAE